MEDNEDDGRRRPLCDYFAIIGYDPASGLKQERITEFGTGGDILSATSGAAAAGAPPPVPLRKSPLDATYEPKVIAHFPAQRAAPGRPFTPEIASLALPQGIRLRTERNVPREQPFFHSFVVIREDGSRIYGCSLIFFEELSSIELRQQIFNAQLGYLREFASSGAAAASASSAFAANADDDSSPSPEAMPSSSEHRQDEAEEVEAARNGYHHQPQHHHHQTMLRSPYHQSIAAARNFTTHSLPRKFAKRFGNTGGGGAHSAVNAGDDDRANAGERGDEEHVTYYKNPQSPLFISKCLAIITPIPIIYSSENLLHNLWALINEKFPRNDYSLEDLLHWMLHELYVPSPACTAQLCFTDFHLLLRVPSPGGAELPFFDYPIETLFAHISVDQFVKLLTSFMLEHQILLISKNARNLMLIAECLSALVFPFCWQMPYCPILPHTQLKFLEAPIPWLMGICVGEQQMPNKQQLYQSNICLLDVDSRQLEVPEDLPSFPRQNRIIDAIKTLLLGSRSAATAADQHHPQQLQLDNTGGVHTFYLRGLQFNAAIRALFLDHFVSLFSTYDGYLLHAGTDNVGIVPVPKSRRKNGGAGGGRMFRESTANFDKISFLVDQPESVLSFLSAFLETQMFTSFIDTKILSAQNLVTNAINVQILDDKIAELSSSTTNGQQQQQQNSPLIRRHLTNASPANLVVEEFPRPRPGCSAVQPRKYGGFLPVPAQAALEVPPPTTATAFVQRTNSAQNRGASSQKPSGEEPFNDENRQQQADDHCNVSSTKCQQMKPPPAAAMAPEVPTAMPPTTNGAVKSAPLNMAAPQNWRFVEQLLKETKAKTKRILVAKMGNEAVHLGHGHLHLGISGVEENTLVASFCDLLERIWSHGLKKKQGKSALWNYIVAYHEWEKKSTREASRRASSASVAGDSASGGEDKVSSSADETSPKAWVDLISSIRRMAASSTSATGTAGDNNGTTSDNAAVSSSSTAAVTATTAVPDWSQSLLRAANVICERMTGGTGGAGSGGSGSSATASAAASGDDERERVVGGGNKARDATNAKSAGRCGATLPPRAPPPSQRVQAPSISQPPVHQRVHPRHVHEAATEADDVHAAMEGQPQSDYRSRSRRHSGDKTATAATMEALLRRRSRTPTPNSKKTLLPVPVPKIMMSDAKTVMVDIVQTEEEISVDKKAEEDDTAAAATYRKFIYKAPLKERSNNNNTTATNQKQQVVVVKPLRRSVSNFQRRPGGGWTNLISDLASHLSEDSLSRLALSSAMPTTAGSDDNSAKGTPTRRRTRDMSSGPAAGGQQPVVPLRPPRNRSLSRSSSPSRLYERLTRGASMGGGGGDLRTIKPLPSTMFYDLKNIMRMTEIKTDIGFARAFVRLALERKLLYLYLKKLLSNTLLLQKMYKRNAFVRCDEEREQFLFHLLSLNAVDFNCFTNTFLTIKMRYEVLLVGSLHRFPASLLYIVMTGSHGCTSSIFLPANSVQFTIDFKNLGTLSTLRIGHSLDNAKANNNNNNNAIVYNSSSNNNLRLSKWFLDYVLVRNCVTAQTFYFRCGRWFGRGIDDGALERLLVAEAIVSRRHCADASDDDEESAASAGTPGGGNAMFLSANHQGTKLEQYVQRCESPMSAAAAFLSPRKAKFSTDGGAAAPAGGTPGGRQRDRSSSRFRSPSYERRDSDFGTSQHNGGAGGGTYAFMDAGSDKLQVLEHRVGIAVNALTKHFLTSMDKCQQSRNAKLSTLLCSEDGGLLPSLDAIFTFGLIQRIFRPMYPWDYIEKVFVWFRQFFCSGESKKFTQEQRSLIIYTYNLVSKIAAHNAVGKEGKFHLFILFSLRDHILSGLLPLIAWTPVTSQFYEQSAFLRQPSKLSYLSKLISTLNEFQFLYEKSLLQGIEAL